MILNIKTKIRKINKALMRQALFTLVENFSELLLCASLA